MRKVLLAVAVFIFTAATTQAQTEKGTLLLGGNIGFQSSNGSSLFMANPNVGLFVANKIAVGAEIKLTAGEGLTVWSVGPFVKPYFAQTEKGAFFAKGSFLAGGSSVEGTSNSNVGFGLGAGYSIFMNKSVAIELAGDFSKVGKNDDGSFGLNVGFQIHFAR